MDITWTFSATTIPLVKLGHPEMIFCQVFGAISFGPSQQLPRHLVAKGGY